MFYLKKPKTLGKVFFSSSKFFTVNVRRIKSIVNVTDSNHLKYFVSEFFIWSIAVCDTYK